MISINKILLVLLVLITLFFGWDLGSSGSSKKDKIIQACRDVIDINTEALGLTSDMLSLSSQVPDVLLEGNLSEIDDLTKQIENKTQEINLLTIRVEPLAEECWGDN